MLRSALINLFFNKKEEAELVMYCLIPEAKQRSPRASVEINLSGKILKLKIEAKDTPALRAACNSYLRWVNTAIKVKAIARK
jgi:tRNA threonylcarbamoyladenosine modification (KEOPS) complex  Pcc1 subunit